MTAVRRTRRDVLRALAAVCAVAAAACTRPRHRTATTSADAAATITPPHARPSQTTSLPPAKTPETPAVGSSAPVSHSVAPPGQPAAFLARSESHRAEISLSFHGSGDPALALELLGIAEHAGAHLTIFAVGQWLAQHPTMARRITGGGHELANHTWSHPSLGRLGAADVLMEITRCRDEIAKRTGAPGSYFRPSAMRTPSPRVLQAAGAAGYRTVVGFDVDTLDFRDPGPVVVSRLAATAKAGSIVSMHLGHPGTVAALPAILRDLHDRGLAAVTVSALLRP
ncbi:MAG: polysaccharide deacetylase family protein [Actinomycetota bacterium]